MNHGGHLYITGFRYTVILNSAYSGCGLVTLSGLQGYIL